MTKKPPDGYTDDGSPDPGRQNEPPFPAQGNKRGRGSTGLTSVGDIITRSRVIKQATSLTPHVTKLLDAAQAIRTEPDDAEAAFIAR